MVDHVMVTAARPYYGRQTDMASKKCAILSVSICYKFYVARSATSKETGRSAHFLKRVGQLKQIKCDIQL